MVLSCRPTSVYGKAELRRCADLGHRGSKAIQWIRITGVARGKAKLKQECKIKSERDLIRAFYAEANGIRVDFSLEERIKRTRIALTPEEKKDSWNREGKWKQVETRTGELVFKIKSPVRMT